MGFVLASTVAASEALVGIYLEHYQVSCCKLEHLTNITLALGTTPLKKKMIDVSVINLCKWNPDVD